MKNERVFSCRKRVAGLPIQKSSSLAGLGMKQGVRRVASTASSRGAGLGIVLQTVPRDG